MSKRALDVTREKNFPEWYQAIVRDGDMAETSPVRGCMIIKPWGWGVWERIQAELDQRIKDTGHENCYFPLFIPMSFIAKEAEHVEGFAKEMAVVTHHRLRNVGGKLEIDPTAKLEEPLIVRPTSETIIGDAFQRWVKSYRDLPLLINQWANVVRWEMRTRLFLRTAEFLWQEGHTAHADRDDAMAETLKMLEVYREFAETVLAMPVIAGEKPANERFPGADNTYSIEAMMQDGKALQAGTSHYLGTHFAQAQNIQFQSAQGTKEFCHTTSWGVSTRLIGGVIMTHGDDDGDKVVSHTKPRAEFVAGAVALLDDIQASLFAEAKARLDGNIVTGITTFDGLKEFFGAAAESDDEGSAFKGWARVAWAKPEGAALEAIADKLKALKLTIRNAPMGQDKCAGKCLFTGQPAVEHVLIARAY